MTLRACLEHRHFDRLGPAGAAVESPQGWGDTLRRFAEQAEKTAAGTPPGSDRR